MRIGLLALLLAMLPLQAGYAGAAEWRQEVDHLLEFIKESPCTFVRNGTSYPSPEARAHIEKKLNHLQSRLSSAEQFIALAASRSSISGKEYQVVCDGQTMPSRIWLESELARVRAARL